MDVFFHLVGAVAVLGFTLGGLVLMFSPRAGGAILTRFAIALVALIFGICVLHQIGQAIFHTPEALLVLLAASVAAYFIKESRLRAKRKDTGHQWGAERTPVMPSHFGEEDRDASNPLGA